MKGEAAQIRVTPQQLIEILGAHRFPLNSEKQCQAAMEDVLTEKGITFEREVQLGPKDVPDFKIGTTVIEVKIGGSKSAIFRQCRRYCEYDGVQDLILASNVAIGLPATVNDRGLWLLPLGRGWL
jgi:hypothetical protein